MENTISLLEAVEEVIGEIKPVAVGLYVDKHRWYEVSVNVYKMEDGYVGVKGPSDCWGDMYWSDCGHLATASEFEEFTAISYRPKK